MNHLLVKYLLALTLVICSTLALSQSRSERPLSQNPTSFKQYVTDDTRTLTSSQISQLNELLSNEDKATTNQIIVYIISSLNGESLEDVSMKLAEKNKIGRKDRNNGVLVLVVKDDRKIRIEVGYGLEGALTDAESSSIIRNVITPEFKKGNYYEGIKNGVDAIIEAIKGEYTADEKSGSDGETCCFGIPIFVIIIFGVIFFVIISSFIKGMFGVGRHLVAGKKGWNSSKWGSGWGGGGWSSGGSSGSSGGFSGGGGSFGGGGASGSW